MAARQLTADDVYKIRHSVHTPLRQLAAEFGVAVTTVARIRAGATYRELADGQRQLPIPLPPGPYATVVADPPWPIGERSRYAKGDDGRRNRTDYPTMTLREIAALPIADILAADAWLLVWTINRYLLHMGELLAGWGCEYRFTMVWHKGVGFQMPGYPQLSAEYLVWGAKGKPALLTTRDFQTSVTAPRGRHSEKPPVIYRQIERVTPGPRCDLFARQVRPGFDCWGLDVPAGFKPDGAQFAGLNDANQLRLPG